MYEAIQKILDKEEQIDYVLSGEFARRIELWSNMYKDKAPWLSPTVQSLCLPASVAGEVARLTTLELQSHISGSSRATYLDKFYQRVCEQLRIQTEYAFAKGGMIFKPYPTAKGMQFSIFRQIRSSHWNTIRNRSHAAPFWISFEKGRRSTAELSCIILMARR